MHRITEVAFSVRSTVQPHYHTLKEEEKRESSVHRRGAFFGEEWK